VFGGVVEVALRRGSGAAGLAAGAVHSMDESALGRGGFVASAAGLVIDDGAAVGDGAAVFEPSGGRGFDVVEHGGADRAEP
jgi:hypothetical protein